MSNPTPPTQIWEARFDKKFVKDHWENHNGVRFNERTLLYISPTFDLETELKSFIRQELKAEREAEKERLVNEVHNWLKTHSPSDDARWQIQNLLGNFLGWGSANQQEVSGTLTKVAVDLGDYKLPNGEYLPKNTKPLEESTL